MNPRAAQSKRSLPLASYPERMSPLQIAQYLNVCENLIRDLIRKGSLPAVNLAGPGAKQGCYRVWRNDVAQFEQRNKS